MRTKTFLLFAALLGLTVTGLHAQIAINNSAANPDASAILDLKSGNAGVNKGFLPQSVVLTNVTLAAPVTSPATGLIVYSSAAPAGGNGTGYYYWTGTAWASMNSTGSGATGQVAFWTGGNSLSGNNNFFWDNTDGWLGIGTATPLRPLQVASSIAFFTGEFDNSTFGGTAILAEGGTAGYGIEAMADYEAVLGTTTNPASYGLVGGNSAASGTSVGTGTYGSTYQSKGFGVAGYNYYATKGVGIGIIGEGSGAANVFLALGSNYPGIYGEGANMGVMGYADNATIVYPVYGANDNGARWASLAYYNGTDYKVAGSGTVSTVVKDINNSYRVMNCPEAPEILFEDYGSATLSAGKVHINLDPTYAKNVTINAKHPLRVLITLEGDCNGVYVTNKTAAGFDVVELKSGVSNVTFTYEVIANRADAYDDNGTLISKNADNRFAEGPAPFKVTTTGTIATGARNPATPPVIAASPAGNTKADTK